MIVTHAACLAHSAGPGHPESPERLRAVLEALDAPEFAHVARREAPLATRAQLLRAHDASLVDALFEQAPTDGYLRIDADTVMSPGSLEAALRAAGAVCAAVEATLAGAAATAFCAVRPPGHHATHDVAMGFCLFNSVAVAAHEALARGVARVAIVDFDVHHGNGTQDIFAADARVMYASSHQAPLYPGTGRADERGVGNVLNAPLPPGAGSAAFREAWGAHVLPAVDAFAPQLLRVSAGFDAHRLDPLAGLDLGSEDYGWITRELVALGARHGAPVVSALEGGYSLTALRESTAAHCRELFAGGGRG